jgi:hypothetical protein
MFATAIVYIKAGFSGHMFGAFVHSVQEMCAADRYCNLLLDEVCIKQNVFFNQKLDCIESF